ncbi:hypothetical protein JHK87_025683 [Glycine soja]|nr:hypothetical protein JHK87_025683 [Glycine soja]
MLFIEWNLKPQPRTHNCGPESRQRKPLEPKNLGPIYEDSAPQETHKNVKDGIISYTNADVVVKLPGWDPAYAKNVAQACLSALKQLIKSDKKLPGKKSLYIRLGCREDWPNIKPPGWDPSSEDNTTLGTQ